MFLYNFGGGPGVLSGFRGSRYLRPTVTGRLFPPFRKRSIIFPGVSGNICKPMCPSKLLKYSLFPFPFARVVGFGLVMNLRWLFAKYGFRDS